MAETQPAVVAGRLSGRDRAITAISLLALAGLAWVWLWFDAASMGDMGAMPSGGMPMDQRVPLAPGALLVTFLMWAIMMVGMMLPSAAPAILLYAGLARKHRERGSAVAPAWSFTAGYLAVWTAFSLGAAILQAGLEELKLVTPMMVSASPWLTGGLLILAGVYQFLPIKDICLRKCRAPLQFLMFHWRSGPTGAFLMGAEHGTFCVGCCWALMLLLFTAGVMNLIWVAVIAGFVLVEKLFPAGGLIGRLSGVAMIAAGVAAMAGVI